MSTTNYNSSQVGVPYVRCNNITIQYGDNQVPVVTVAQELAVLLANGSVIQIGTLPSLSFSLDMVHNATTPIPLVDPTTGNSLGANTTLQSLMLSILAAVRQQQLIQNP